MPDRSRIAIAAALLLVAAASGCAKTYAPRGVLPAATEALSNPYGAWVHVEYRYNARLMAEVEGELIAVTPDSLYLLRPGVLRAIACASIEKAQAESYQSAAGAIAGYTVLGILSTVSHGFYLIITAPVWIVTGSIAAGAETREPIIRYPNESLAGFAAYARFPAGLPVRLDRGRFSRAPWLQR